MELIRQTEKHKVYKVGKSCKPDEALRELGGKNFRYYSITRRRDLSVNGYKDAIEGLDVDFRKHDFLIITPEEQ